MKIVELPHDDYFELFLQYEVTGSWLSYIPFCNGLIARYSIWKTTRKLKRCNEFAKRYEKLKEL